MLLAPSESVNNQDGTSTTTNLVGNDYFGEEILKGGGAKKYVSTVTSTGKTNCWMLQKTDVKRVVGSTRASSNDMVA